MSTVRVTTTNGSTVPLDDSAIDAFKSSLRGSLLRPGDAGYDQSRTVWNAMIDRKPALIARCAGVADVRAAVTFAREHSFLTAVRGGGHNIAGNAVCDGGFQIDLSAMRSVRIDPVSRVAHVEPGATLGDFDHEAQAFGLATPLGINSTTGVAGLTLGAGFGWLSRKYGMTIDNLTAADVVTADGHLVHANQHENADLFWAIRGGSGNFGIVTRFEFKLYPLGPGVLCGVVVYAAKDAVSLLKQYREFAKKLDTDSSVWVILRKAPPLPFLPPHVHGTDVVVFGMFHAGNPEVGRRSLEPVRKFGTPVGEHVGINPYTAWQSMFDPLLTPGARNYWKSHNFTDLSDKALETAVRHALAIPYPSCEIALALLGGATSKPAPDATAYSHRDAFFVMNVHGRWDSANDDAKCIEWARTLFRDMTPFATGGVYVNFLTDDESDRVRTAYGPGYDRLAAVKQKYDPQNLFRMNQNIHPSGKPQAVPAGRS